MSSLKSIDAVAQNSANLPVQFVALLAAAPIIMTSAIALAQEQETKLGPAFAFVDRFPEGTAKIGFVEGESLSVGTLIRFDESLGDPIDIVSATASNGIAEYTLESISLGFVQGWQALPAPMLDLDSHLGVWTVTVEDAKGHIQSLDALSLDHGITLPYVENIGAASLESGELEVSWSTPDLSEIGDNCTSYVYRLRVLRDFDNQLFRSGAIAHEASETSYKTTVPKEKVVEMGDLQDVWARVELQCRDSEEPGAESRSNAFAALGELLSQ